MCQAILREIGPRHLCSLLCPSCYLSSSAAESALDLWYLGIRNQKNAGCQFSHSGLEKHKYQEVSETVKVITNCETCLPEDLGKVTECDALSPGKSLITH